MDIVTSIIIVGILLYVLNLIFGKKTQVKNSLLDLYKVRHVDAIADRFKTLDEVSEAVRKAGLESSNLIFGRYNTYC